MKPRQLPLDLGGKPDYGRDTFIPGRSNGNALAFIEQWPHWPSSPVVLTGPEGSGKTHLARIWSDLSGATLVAAADLPAFGALDALSDGACVVEDVTPGHVPEHELFHLINAAREARAALLVTARVQPSAWGVTLPDLASRLRLATPLTLEPPDDLLLRQVLVKLFVDRQLDVDKTVVDFLVLRMERSLGEARRIVAALDHEALSRGRRITRPIAASVLAESGAGIS